MEVCSFFMVDRCLKIFIPCKKKESTKKINHHVALYKS